MDRAAIVLFYRFPTRACGKNTKSPALWPAWFILKYSGVCSNLSPIMETTLRSSSSERAFGYRASSLFFGIFIKVFEQTECLPLLIASAGGSFPPDVNAIRICFSIIRFTNSFRDSVLSFELPDCPFWNRVPLLLISVFRP